MIYFYRYLLYLQLFDSFDNNSIIVKGKQKDTPIICIYVIYVTVRIKHRFLDFFYNLTSLYFLQLCLIK